nr:hypothetical protein [uncultured Roseococcus sp.]
MVLRKAVKSTGPTFSDATDAIVDELDAKALAEKRAHAHEPERIQRRKGATFAGNRTIINTGLKPVIGGLTYSDITRSAVDRLLLVTV